MFKNYWWTGLMILIISFCFIAIGKAVYIYWEQFHMMKKSNDPAHWGVFGDYLGGTLNPPLTLINITVTVWLAILVNRYANLNTDRQLKAAIDIAKVQLKHEALKDLRGQLNPSYNAWRSSSNPVNQKKYSKACLEILHDFADHYSYLFDLNNVESFKSLYFAIQKYTEAVESNNLSIMLETQMQVDLAKQALYAELGQVVIN